MKNQPEEIVALPVVPPPPHTSSSCSEELREKYHEARKLRGKKIAEILGQIFIEHEVGSSEWHDGEFGWVKLDSEDLKFDLSSGHTLRLTYSWGYGRGRSIWRAVKIKDNTISLTKLRKAASDILNEKKERAEFKARAESAAEERLKSNIKNLTILSEQLKSAGVPLNVDSDGTAEVLLEKGDYGPRIKIVGNTAQLLSSKYTRDTISVKSEFIPRLYQIFAEMNGLTSQELSAKIQQQ